ncbi:MAG: L-seryl-tRNA(Sec) selenium transferase [Thiotrichales bacterium]|nr:L-seryl-tRNA(Sec) selenium transferase [Thiotrichales bacterium]
MRLRRDGPFPSSRSLTRISSPAELPSVDRLLAEDAVTSLIRSHGRPLVLEAARGALDEARAAVMAGGAIDRAELAESVEARVRALAAPSLVPLYNLTGTVLHTNLGRAPLPEAAIASMAAVARGASNLEFDLATGRRGDRHRHVEPRLCRLTSAQAAIVVNNNAAAVLLVLDTLAKRKEVPVSRGELIEIGGAFRMPDIMKRAGVKLVEVGTTNRTHLRDYESVIGPRTALLMKVHTSNYAVEGFTSAVGERDLAVLARARSLPLVSDLGSGSLVDMTALGLPPEPTVRAMIADGVDLVTFSGDKLLGGPQAGIVAGRKDLVARLKRNPLMRALRPDKITLAALQSVLALYEDPSRLSETLPSLRLLGRPRAEIEAQARRVRPALAACLGADWTVEVVRCRSQIGSGALPVDRLPSAGLRCAPASGAKRGRSSKLQALATALRMLPTPVIGRVHDGAPTPALRCLADEANFVAQLDRLAAP